MHHGQFSQMPVYSGQSFSGLLTAETVMRWVADCLEDGVGLIEETSVEQVLEYTVDPENHAFVPTRATLFDALDYFDDFRNRGKSLDAILLTDSGSPHPQLTVILTIFDIPKILSVLRL